MNSNQIRDYIQYLNPKAYKKLKAAGTLKERIDQLTSQMNSRELDIRDRLREQMEKSKEYQEAQETNFEEAMRMATQIPLIAEEMVRAEAEEIVKAM